MYKCIILSKREETNMNELTDENLKKIKREKIKALAEEYEFKVKTIKKQI